MIDPTPQDFEYQCHYDASQKLQKWDVWGWSREIPQEGFRFEHVHSGMMVAYGGQKCPIFGDVVPYKSATLLIDTKKLSEKGATLDDVYYWIRYVQGGEPSPSQTKHVEEGVFAVRSDYHAW